MKRDVTYYIRRLLYRYDCVIVPKLGGFVGSYQSAQILSAIQTIKPPYKKISFNIHLNSNDGLLANEIAHGEGIDYESARSVLSKFVDECMKRLASGESVRLEHIGDLFYDLEQNLQYKSIHDTNFLKTSFGLSSMRVDKVDDRTLVSEQEKVVVPIRKKKEKEAAPEEIVLTPPTEKKTYWKVAAVLIPLIGLAAFGFVERNTISTVYDQYARFGSYIFDREEQYETRDKGITEESEQSEDNWISEKILPEEESPNNNLALESDPETKIETAEDGPLNETEVEETGANDSDASNEPRLEESRPYHIVAGCFGVVQNAENLAEDLQVNGYSNSRILSEKHKNLSVVVYNSFSTRAQAKQELLSIQEGRQKDAWVLKK